MNWRICCSNAKLSWTSVQHARLWPKFAALHSFSVMMADVIIMVMTILSKSEWEHTKKAEMMRVLIGYSKSITRVWCLCSPSDSIAPYPFSPFTLVLILFSPSSLLPAWWESVCRKTEQDFIWVETVEVTPRNENRTPRLGRSTGRNWYRALGRERGGAGERERTYIGLIRLRRNSIYNYVYGAIDADRISSARTRPHHTVSRSSAPSYSFSSSPCLFPL